MSGNLLEQVFVDLRSSRDQLDSRRRNDIGNSAYFVAFRYGRDRLDVIGRIINERLSDGLLRWDSVVFQR